MRYRVKTLQEAIAKLKELGIQYREIRRDWFQSTRFERFTNNGSVHWYFMWGPGDVAYFTPCMESLNVHETPRVWSQQNLDALVAA